MPDPWMDKLSPELRNELRKGGSAGALLGTGLVHVMIQFKPDVDPWPVLRKFGQQGVEGEIRYISRVSPIASAVVRVEDVEKIAQEPTVEKVWHVPRVTILPPGPWTEPAQANGTEVPSGAVVAAMRGTIDGTGHGAIVGIVDSGIDADHPAFRGRIVDYRDFTGTGLTDTLAHGCVHGDAFVYTSYCGLVRIQELYERLDAKYGSRQTAHGSTVLLSAVDPVAGTIPVVPEAIYTIGHDGESQRTRVHAVHKVRVNGDVFRVRAAKGEWLLTPWHPCLVKNTRGNLLYRRADALRRGDYLVMPEKPVDVVEKGIIDGTVLDERLAYLLGLVLADGSLHQKSGCSRIHCGSEEEARVIASVIGEFTGRIPSTGRKSGTNAWFVYLPEELVKVAVSAGIPRGDKCTIVGIPEPVWKSPASVRAAFIAGIVDGDGSFSYPRNGLLRIVTASETMARQLPPFLSLLGVTSGIFSDAGGREHVYAGRTIRAGPSWTISIAGANLRTLLPLMGSHLRLKNVPRPKAGFRKDRHCTKVLGTKVETFDGWFYDFTTDVQNYVAGTREMAFIHNTHVAGLLAASPIDANGVRIEGMAPGARLVVAKIFGDQSTTADVVMQAMEWVSDRGAHIVNMSWGQPDPYPLLREHIRTIGEKRGTTFVAAAGNEAGSNRYPAAYPEVVSVGSVAFRLPSPNAIAAFTASGPGFGKSQLPDLSAYGGSEQEAIISTIPGGVGAMRGTSMAAPFVSGAIAVLRGSPFSLPGPQAVDLLERTAIDTGPLGVDPRTGYGVVDVQAAVLALETGEVPEAPEVPVVPKEPTGTEQGVALVAFGLLALVAFAILRERRAPRPAY